MPSIIIFLLITGDLEPKISIAASEIVLELLGKTKTGNINEIQQE